MASPGASRSRRVSQPGVAREGDPTGCGDVWGSALFAGLLNGKNLDEAMEEANRMAMRNFIHKGADGLHHHLTGRLAGGTPR
jgi:sugar/nucleoside kinase (ribokinase family)